MITYIFPGKNSFHFCRTYVNHGHSLCSSIFYYSTSQCKFIDKYRRNVGIGDKCNKKVPNVVKKLTLKIS